VSGRPRTLPGVGAAWAPARQPGAGLASGGAWSTDTGAGRKPVVGLAGSLADRPGASPSTAAARRRGWSRSP